MVGQPVIAIAFEHDKVNYITADLLVYIHEAISFIRQVKND